MRIIFILLATTVIASSCSGIKRLQKGEQLSTIPVSLVLEGEGDINPVVDINYKLVIPKDYIKGKSQVIYQPQFLNTANVYDLQPVVINTKRSARKEQKRLKKGEELFLPEAIRVTPGKEPMSIDYDLRVPVKDWMPDSELVGWTIHNCCAGKNTVYDRDVIASGILIKEPAKPAYKEVSKDVVIPMELHEAIYFIINDDNVDTETNAKSIEQVKALVADVNSNKMLKLSCIDVVGSASPDGTVKINNALSNDRAEIVANMLVSDLCISPDLINTSSTGANWKGFCELVSNSSLSNKSEILKIANSDKSDWVKTLELRKLPNYNTIKSEILPELRNVSCIVKFNKTTQVVEMIEM